MKLRKIPDSVRKYVYEPLDLTKRQIRLLAVRPSSSSDDPVQCDVEVFDMDDAPYYVALSYTWGEALSIRYMILNGRWLRISKNLFNFLLCFRDDPSNVHYLWIDQLCIAQKLDLERNHQVQLMSRIYERCLYVIMWLGSRSYDGAFCFNRDSTMTSAHGVFDNPYFERLWVVQEILLAPEIRVFCGWNDEWIKCFYAVDEAYIAHITEPDILAVNISTGLPLQQLIEDTLSQEYDIEDTEIRVNRVWVELNSLVSVMRSGEMSRYPKFFDSVFGNPDVFPDPQFRTSLSLTDGITRFCKYECSNPRDKVYGLLGLVVEDQRPVVDYNKSEEEVLADVIMIMTELYWQEIGDQRTIPNTKVLTQYWKDVLCLTRLANEMGLEQHCHAISYLLQEVYDVITKLKTTGKTHFPIQGIGFNPNNENEYWWFKSEDREVYLKDYPNVPAWTNMGLDMLLSGVPERFQPHPLFHVDGTPWLQNRQENDGGLDVGKAMCDHEMLSRLLIAKTPLGAISPTCL